MRKICLVLLVLFAFTFSSVSAKEVPKVDTGQLIIVNKTTNQLAFYDNHQLVGIFKVATGRVENYTPVGTFSIIFKVKNPWYKDLVAGGSPKNPLGYRWIGIDARGTSGGKYGIHGNNNPSSIGTYASAGCVRMYNDENIWLYDRVKMYTKVVILHSTKSFNEIAEDNGYTMDSFDVERINAKVTTNFKTYLYDQKESSATFKPTFKTVAAGTVLEAFEEKGSWYHVHTPHGDKWISNTTAVEGELSKTKTVLTLSEKTNTFLSPNSSVVEESLSPQTIESFENIGEWHHIKTKEGNRWIEQKDESKIYLNALTLLFPAIVR